MRTLVYCLVLIGSTYAATATPAPVSSFFVGLAIAALFIIVKRNLFLVSLAAVAIVTGMFSR
ncbi:hypothetical protein [Neoaquamicrobium sediminum]|uniref:hypothetical protein n=1 Tax=Neoaquamicrobium sediminum TaxID=1849104 RepID=UPI0040375358